MKRLDFAKGLFIVPFLSFKKKESTIEEFILSKGFEEVGKDYNGLDLSRARYTKSTTSRRVKIPNNHYDLEILIFPKEDRFMVYNGYGLYGLPVYKGKIPTIIEIDTLFKLLKL